jgi:hypothetical protein
MLELITNSDTGLALNRYYIKAHINLIARIKLPRPSPDVQPLIMLHPSFPSLLTSIFIHTHNKAPFYTKSLGIIFGCFWLFSCIRNITNYNPLLLLLITKANGAAAALAAGRG